MEVVIRRVRAPGGLGGVGCRDSLAQGKGLQARTGDRLTKVLAPTAFCSPASCTWFCLESSHGLQASIEDPHMGQLLLSTAALVAGGAATFEALEGDRAEGHGGVQLQLQLYPGAF